MQAALIDGRLTRDALVGPLMDRIRKLERQPTLAIIQVGKRPDSTAFIAAKRAFAKKIGAREIHIHLAETISEKDVIARVQECNADRNIHGIIVQLPLPLHIDRDHVIEAILPAKDADGLTAANMKALVEGLATRPLGETPPIMPATARGIRELLDHNGYELFGKKVTVIGRSLLVGKPIALMCLNENATVTVCHSKTTNLAEETAKADIIVSATGKPGLITADHVRPGQVVIDVGITRMEDNKFVGDVDFETVSKIVSAITPVPGGVGPMTVLALFENLVDLAHGA